MAPSSDKVTVACEALRSDAKKWMTASDEMTAAAAGARNLQLGRDQFGRAAENIGVVAAYTVIQQRLEHLLAGAGGEFDKVAGALKTSADIYERQDAASAHNLNRAGH